MTISTRTTYKTKDLSHLHLDTETIKIIKRRQKIWKRLQTILDLPNPYIEFLIKKSTQ